MTLQELNAEFKGNVVWFNNNQTDLPRNGGICTAVYESDKFIFCVWDNGFYYTYKFDTLEQLNEFVIANDIEVCSHTANQFNESVEKFIVGGF
jgi:hypothetical protein